MHLAAVVKELERRSVVKGIITLAENPCSVPSTQTGMFIADYTSSYGNIERLWPLWAPVLIHTYTNYFFLLLLLYLFYYETGSLHSPGCPDLTTMQSRLA